MRNEGRQKFMCEQVSLSVEQLDECRFFALMHKKQLCGLTTQMSRRKSVMFFVSLGQGKNCNKLS